MSRLKPPELSPHDREQVDLFRRLLAWDLPDQPDRQDLLALPADLREWAFPGWGDLTAAECCTGMGV